MSRFSRAASFAATCFCAVAATGGIPSDPAAGATILSPVVSEALPSVPVIESLPGDGISTDPALNLPSVAIPDRAVSLASLVAHHGLDRAGDSEANCLATAVYFESKGEPLAGQLAVAEVIMNRAKSGRFAKTLCGVVKQPSQFSFVRGGGFPAVGNKAMWRQAVGVAHVAMNGLWDGPAANALFFHAKRVSPRWSKQRVASVGNHIFYR